MTIVQYSLLTTDEGSFITVLIDGEDYSSAEGQPGFKEIVALVADNVQNGTVIDKDKLLRLFAPAKAAETKFQRLSERVTVAHGEILLDGDPVAGPLQQQILDFLDAGEDFEPLVKFYEKLLTNPLGDVRESAYQWIQRQQQRGRVTITSEGDLLGYKSVAKTEPEYRKDVTEVYVPSRRGAGIVNGRDVLAGEFIEQVPGDIVEMPRSKVLHAPSRACGDGLHIGTYQYASTFRSGGCGHVMLVKFNPRDIVSVPTIEGKIRVCRYTVVKLVDGPLDVPVYQAEADKPAPASAVVNTRPDSERPSASKPDLNVALPKRTRPVPVDKLTRDQLRAEAKQREVSGRGSMTRDELQDAVKRARRSRRK